MRFMSSRGLGFGAVAALCFGLLTNCGGAPVDSDDGSAGTIEPGTDFTDLIDFPPLESLTSADVQQVIAQAVNEAQAQGVAATIAVTDRVGNVLAIFEMNGASQDLAAIAEVPRTISESGPLDGNVLLGADGSGIDGFTIPLVGARLGAVSKSVTGSYLSSNGNAFSTRTANQIIQENFNPQESLQAGGPLFGVQFSQLTCSDLSTRFESNNGAGTAVGDMVGPRRSPLGLAADPGGLPLYKNGTHVGGIGVISDGVYGIDINIVDTDSDLEIQDELIALAGTIGFDAPRQLRAERVTVEGNTLRFTDTVDDTDRFQSDPASAPGFASILGSAGRLIALTGYYATPNGGTAADVLAGTAYGDPASGYMPASDLPGGSPFTNPNAFILVDGAGNPRFSPKNANDAPGGDPANRLKRREVVSLIDSAIGVALAGRAQIRRPLNSPIQVTVSVVDTNGEILGVARTPDGPIFGTDVSLQKARTAMFFSSATAGDDLLGLTLAAGTEEIDTADVITNPALFNLGNVLPDGLIPDSFANTTETQRIILKTGEFYVNAARRFVGPDALTGQIAFSDRGNGNLSRPFFPDGLNEQVDGDASPNGPFSRPFNSPDTTDNWSPFSTGLQFDLIAGNVLQHILWMVVNEAGIPNDAAGLPFLDSPVGCVSIGAQSGQINLLPARDALVFPRGPLANGAQIFAGSVPIYRDGILIGGIGVSGDGIDQDDMISSLGLRRAGLRVGNGLGHAPEAIRSDTVIPRQGNGVRLRYVSCPFRPFVNSRIQNACQEL